MKIGAFQIDEPLPNLYKPHAFAILRPWIDAGSVGTLTANLIEDTFHAQPLGKLATPGNFYDFTRYRPNIKLVDGKRTIDIPNSRIFLASYSDGNDLVFLHLLEPHMSGEYYAESVVDVLQALGIQRYTLLGSMYDSVPHTKSLLVSGMTSGDLMKELHPLGVQTSKYEGPTTITMLISQEAPKHNIEALSMIVHLPQYAQLDKNYAGHLRLMEILSSLYNFPIDLSKLRHKAERQRDKLDQAMKREKQLEQLVQQLEMLYEARDSNTDEELPRLSPEIEKFLSEIDKGFQLQ
jgi:predicted ATP-grasp superfamily ATP-dependent carboligase